MRLGKYFEPSRRKGENMDMKRNKDKKEIKENVQEPKQQETGCKTGEKQEPEPQGEEAVPVSEENGSCEETDKKYEDMEKQLQEYKEKVAEANDKYVRMAAEFDNFRRRTARERLELINTASEDVIKGILPVLDDFERAIKVLKESDSSAAAIEGTELIYNKLFSFLKSKGLSVIEALDKELDTEFHEAVAQFPTEEKDKKNKVIDIVQQGYMLNGKVVRYAKVVVGV